MSNQRIRIGQVGITSHGATIVSAIRASSSLELTSVLDIKSEEAKKISQELSVKQAGSYEEMLLDPAIDAVALVTPNQLHAEQVAKAAKAGKHVFVEKPIAGSVAEAKKMIAAMKRAGLVLFVGHNTRRRPMFRRAKKILEDRQLGIVVGAEMNMSRPAGLFQDIPRWKASPKITPLLPMTQLGIHFVDVIHYLFAATTTSVSCFAVNAAMKGGALDASVAILRLGLRIPITLSSYYVTPDVYSVRIYGTKGILSCSVTELTLDLLQDGSLQRAIRQDYSQEGFASYNEEMSEFGECILTGRRPETGGKEGLEALAVVEAMVQSIRTNKTVNVNSILRGSP